MKKSLLLIGALLLGMTAATVAKADNCGCYAETRSEGISLCQRGMHQKAIEFFVAAKNCNDVPADNDLDLLIGKCRDHMSTFSITKLVLGNSDGDFNQIGEFGDSFHSSDLFYLTPRITYSSSREESITIGIKVIKPDGEVYADEDEEYSYSQTIEAKAGDNIELTLYGFGTVYGGVFSPGTYTVELWARGRCLASAQTTVLEDEPKVLVNGEKNLSIEFPVLGGRKHIEVTDFTNTSFDTWLLPDFCAIENLTETGFDLVCDANKTPAYRTDSFLVYVDDYSYSANVTVVQDTYANATRLLIDGKTGEDTEIKANFEYYGGKTIFYVDTDSPDYDFWGIPYFCSIEKKTPTSFFIVCEANDMAYEKNDWFKVKAGKLEVTIYITLASNPNGESYEYEGEEAEAETEVNTDLGFPNIIGEIPTWTETLSHIMENPVTLYSDNSCYKGLLENGVREGFGAYYWSSGIYYFGEWENGERSGMGICILCDFDQYFTNCPNAVVYVGEFKDSNFNGIGSCYDKDGNLIYDGEFVDGVPQSEFPNGDSFSPGYKFQIVHATEGEWRGWYIGETLYTDRHGWGLFIWEDFDSCFGKFTDGVRSTEVKQLFMSRDGKEIDMRQY